MRIPEFSLNLDCLYVLTVIFGILYFYEILTGNSYTTEDYINCALAATFIFVGLVAQNRALNLGKGGPVLTVIMTVAIPIYIIYGFFLDTELPTLLEILGIIGVVVSLIIMAMGDNK